MIAKISRHGLTLLVGALVAFLGIQAWNWYNPPKGRTVYRVAPTPYRAPDSRLERGIARVVVPTEIVALRPNKREIQKIESKLGGKLPAGQEILSIKEIDLLPHGGRGVIGLVENPDGTSEATLTIYPKAAPFFEWKLERSLGVYYGVGMDRIAGPAWNVEFEQGLFRVGPAELSLRAGLLGVAGGSDAYVMVGGRVKF